MNGREQVSVVFPKPGRALTAVLVVTGALGIFTAFLAGWTPGGANVLRGLAFEPGRPVAMPWRWLTSGFVTSPESWSHLFFSLIGVYFLGAPLEQRWGSWRFSRFLAASVVMGNLVTLAVDRCMPPGAAERFHPAFVFGPTAAIAATAIAWSREYADSTVQLFFVVPVRGVVLFWVTIGFCVLDLVYPAGMPEGVVAPFGGLLAGLLLGGTPSPLRAAWLRLRLAVLRRRGGPTAQDILAHKPARRPRTGTPPLRVVPGGLDEVLKKRQVPKDKRYLN